MNTPSSATWTVANGGEPLSDAAIAALARLLLDVDENEPAVDSILRNN